MSGWVRADTTYLVCWVVYSENSPVIFSEFWGCFTISWGQHAQWIFDLWSHIQRENSRHSPSLRVGYGHKAIGIKEPEQGEDHVCHWSTEQICVNRGRVTHLHTNVRRQMPEINLPKF